MAFFFKLLHFFSLHVTIYLQTNSPFPTTVPAIRLLFGEERPTDNRNTAGNTFDRRIPPTMSQEPSNRRVVQDLFLRAPTGQHPSVFGLRHELRWQNGSVAGNNVRSNYPQKVLLAFGESPSELSELLSGHDSDATEIHVHNGDGLLGIEPIYALGVFFPEIGAYGFQFIVGGDLVRIDDGAFERVECVDDDRRGSISSIYFADEEIEHKVIWVIASGSDEGTPNSSAASRVKLMLASETIHVTGGTSGDDDGWLSLEIKLEKGTKQFLEVESQREGMSWVESASQGGRPSGMVLKRKSGKPSRELGPLDLRRRLWLYSVLTKIENDKLKKEKVSLLKNKDLADGQVMVLTRSLEALQKDLKDKEILVQDLKQSLERQRKELNDCRAEITSLKMHIEGSRSGWNLVAGEIEHPQSESLESYKEEIKLLQKEIESLKAGKFIVTESVESIDHETKFIETKDEVVDFHENSAVAPPVDMTSGVLETVGAQLLANQTSDDTNDKSDTAPRETLVSCSNDNNGAIESAEHVSKHNGEPVPEDNGLLLKSDSPGTEPVPEKMGLAGVLGSPSKQEQLTETCYSVCLTTSIGGGVRISKQTRTIDRVLEKSVSSKCSAGGSANEAPC
ncbi:unnamed protein product [Camellia sinensis]